MTIWSHLFAFRTPSDAARVLAEKRVQGERELIKARARQMREQLGLPPLEVLR